jgi:hypothetical protein
MTLGGIMKRFTLVLLLGSLLVASANADISPPHGATSTEILEGDAAMTLAIFIEAQKSGLPKKFPPLIGTIKTHPQMDGKIFEFTDGPWEFRRGFGADTTIGCERYYAYGYHAICKLVRVYQ